MYRDVPLNLIDNNNNNNIIRRRGVSIQFIFDIDHERNALPNFFSFFFFFFYFSRFSCFCRIVSDVRRVSITRGRRVLL